MLDGLGGSYPHSHDRYRRRCLLSRQGEGVRMSTILQTVLDGRGGGRRHARCRRRAVDGTLKSRN